MGSAALYIMQGPPGASSSGLQHLYPVALLHED